MGSVISVGSVNIGGSVNSVGRVNNGDSVKGVDILKSENTIFQYFEDFQMFFTKFQSHCFTVCDRAFWV